MVLRGMGLLDDAIRDHLELKRRRGADPGEVEREQHEALDPPTGAGAPVATDESSAPGAAAEIDERLTSDGGPEASGAGLAGGELTETPEDVQETAEVDMQAVMDAQSDERDVLEQTPEFLRETPEHERLWFEQRPPRDFDFDG
jgi:hypothetical protein